MQSVKVVQLIGGSGGTPYQNDYYVYDSTRQQGGKEGKNKREEREENERHRGEEGGRREMGLVFEGESPADHGEGGWRWRVWEVGLPEALFLGV